MTVTQDEIETALRYRLRAEQLRKIADGVGDADVNTLLKRLAKDYEAMADAHERVAGARAGVG